jgi:hypothetical protein
LPDPGSVLIDPGSPSSKSDHGWGGLFIHHHLTDFIRNRMIGEATVDLPDTFAKLPESSRQLRPAA